MTKWTVAESTKSLPIYSNLACFRFCCWLLAFRLDIVSSKHLPSLPHPTFLKFIFVLVSIWRRRLFIFNKLSWNTVVECRALDPIFPVTSVSRVRFRKKFSSNSVTYKNRVGETFQEIPIWCGRIYQLLAFDVRYMCEGIISWKLEQNDYFQSSIRFEYCEHKTTIFGTHWSKEDGNVLNEATSSYWDKLFQLVKVKFSQVTKAWNSSAPVRPK